MLEKISPNVGYVVGVGALVVGAAAFSVGRAEILPDTLTSLPTDSPITQTLKLGYTELAYAGDQNGALAAAGAGAAMLGGVIARISLQKMKENAAETKRYNTVLAVANGVVIATAAAGFVAGLAIMGNAMTQDGLYSPIPQVPSIVLTPSEGYSVGAAVTLISVGLGGAHVATAPYRLRRRDER
jgi:hypothetical protein